MTMTTGNTNDAIELLIGTRGVLPPREQAMAIPSTGSG
jgi:hypothetical protein